MRPFSCFLHPRAHTYINRKKDILLGSHFRCVVQTFRIGSGFRIRVLDNLELQENLGNKLLDVQDHRFQDLHLVLVLLPYCNQCLNHLEHLLHLP